MKFTDTIEAWLLRFDEVKIRMRDQLNAPANETEISEFEQLIGQPLTDDHKAFYQYANGQQSPYKVTYYTDRPNKIELPFPLAEGESVGNLFGGYEFLSLEQAKKQWIDIKDISKTFSDNNFITVRDGDFVHPHYLDTGWIPLAMDGGGNFYGVDMNPPEGGTKGQVILFGPDEDQRRVLGNSISDLFNKLAENPISGSVNEDQRYWFNLSE